MMQDYQTSAQAVMDTDHALIHLEKGYSVTIDTGSLAHTSGVEKAVFRTPSKASKLSVHLRVPGFSAAASLMKLSIYEDAAYTGGTKRTIVNHFRKTDPKVSQSTFLQDATVSTTTKNLNTAAAGGDFGNQPNNDDVQVVSDDNDDKGQIVTIYGTLHGADAVIVTETATLNGTTAVDFDGKFGRVLGVEMSAEADGTVTIKEKSGGLTITTLATTETSAGIVTITDNRGRDQIISAVADGATTKYIGMMARKPDKSEFTHAMALNGNTIKAVGTEQTRFVDRLLIGDVEAARTVTFSRAAVKIMEILGGSGGGVQSNSGGGGSNGDERILEPETDYIIEISNIGGTNASKGYLTLFFYEEDY